jgi:hypothetical protein
MVNLSPISAFPLALGEAILIPSPLWVREE